MVLARGIKGFICGVTPVVSITHKVGQKELRIGRQVVIISRPFRYFYQYRNYLWLLRRKYVPLQWKVALGVKLSLRILYFPFCVRNGKEIEKNMFKGIWSGLRENKDKSIKEVELLVLSRLY